tara:strand:- start:94 stop:327 length:234 start_codon:yes stop_codon:yes gene_type:complete
MKYYISTIQDCEDIKKLQDSFLGYPSIDTKTTTYSDVFGIENSSDYLLVISDEYYDNLSDAQKAKCKDELTVELIEL